MYTFNLSKKRLEPLMLNLSDLLDDIKKELEDFIGFILENMDK